MKTLDPYMITFLLDHSAARSVVYKMMKNAATTKDDPKMIEWYKTQKIVPCKGCDGKGGGKEECNRCCGDGVDPGVKE